MLGTERNARRMSSSVKQQFFLNRTTTTLSISILGGGVVSGGVIYKFGCLFGLTTWVSSSPPGENGRHFGRRQFQMHFLEWKWLHSDSNFTEISFQESNLQKASTDSSNALAPNRRKQLPEPMLVQWTDTYMRHYGRWDNVICTFLHSPFELKLRGLGENNQPVPLFTKRTDVSP